MRMLGLSGLLTRSFISIEDYTPHLSFRCAAILEFIGWFSSFMTSDSRKRLRVPF